MPFNVWYGALLLVDVLTIVQCAEAHGRHSLIFVRQAALEEQSARAFKNSSVSPFNYAIRLRAMRVRFVMAETKLAANRVELGRAVGIPEFDFLCPHEVLHCNLKSPRRS